MVRNSLRLSYFFFSKNLLPTNSIRIMISIILAIILGLIFTAVAFQNPGNTIVNFFGNAYSIPTYLFAAISFLVGVFVAMFFNLFDAIGTSLGIHKVESANNRLQHQVEQLHAENVDLRARLGETQANLREEKVEHTKSNVKNLFGRIRHNLS